MNRRAECKVHKLITDTTLFYLGQVLLVKYKNINKYDHQTGWFISDDQLLKFEHPERGAARIAKEQLGLTVKSLQLGFIESFKGGGGSWHITFHYVSKLDEKLEIKPSSDIKESRWFPINELPPRKEVAHHGWALSVINRLQK